MSGAIIGTLFAAVLLPLLLNEVGEIAPWLANRLLRWGARRLGSTERAERYSEEWLADLDRVPGRLTKLLHACSIVVRSVPQMRRQAGSARSLRRDRLAWNRVVDREMPLVWHLIRAHGMDTEHASKVSQIVWVRYVSLFNRRQPRSAHSAPLASIALDATREYLASVLSSRTANEEVQPAAGRSSPIWQAYLRLSAEDRVLLTLISKKGVKFSAAVLGLSHQEAAILRRQALSRLDEHNIAQSSSAMDVDDTEHVSSLPVPSPKSTAPTVSRSSDSSPVSTRLANRCQQ